MCITQEQTKLNVLCYYVYIPEKTMQLTITVRSDEAHFIDVPTDASIADLMSQLKVSMINISDTYMSCYRIMRVVTNLQK